MKKALLLSFALTLVAGAAFGQGGSVGIFADAGGLSCNLTDAPAGLKQYYVVHKATNVTASQYRATVPACMTGATYLSDTNMFGVTLGNSQTGVAVAYGYCASGAVHTQTISVFAAGLTAPCCYWLVDADPLVPSGRIEVSTCQFETIFADGGEGIINPQPSCDCNVPNEDTTWGQVKALYE